MDHNGDKSTGSTDRSREYPAVVSPEMSSSTGLKCCEICRTTKTPLWRGGPSGPKSVCNACGIRYRKKRREILGLSTGAEKPKKESKSVVRLLEFGTDLLRKRRSLLPVKRKRRLAEEEEAAVLLMALSSGLLYA